MLVDVFEQEQLQRVHPLNIHSFVLCYDPSHRNRKTNMRLYLLSGGIVAIMLLYTG